jgi:hypothetical protein
VGVNLKAFDAALDELERGTRAVDAAIDAGFKALGVNESDCTGKPRGVRTAGKQGSSGAVQKIDAGTLAVLSNCTVQGESIALPPGRLERKQYEAVNKVLELMGGKWNRKAQAHVFSEAPGDLMDTVILTGEITDKKKLFQFYETPAALAARMVELAGVGVGSRVLEPSAGHGGILRAIGNGPDKVAFEIDPDKVAKLAKCGVSGLQIIQCDFLDCVAATEKFDAVIMNPPFTRGQDVRHILHARGFLKPGAVLVAICANGPRQREALQGIAERWEDLSAGTFAESGTGVNTALVVIRG